MALKQLLALSTIHLTVEPGKAGDRAKGIAPVKPRVKIIPGNARFKAMDADQEKELIGMGAAREMTKEEIGEADNTLIDAKAEVKTISTQTEGERLEAAKAEYEEVFGEAPNGNMKVETMEQRIAEKKAESKDSDDETKTEDLV